MTKLNLLTQLNQVDNNQQVCTLRNASYYFLDHVVIIDEKDHYRLIVVKNRKKLMDKTYLTSKGASIAFTKRFKRQCTFITDAIPEWNSVYQPEPGWLAMILSCQ